MVDWLCDWFEWNGVKCTEYGMHALGLPSIIMPKERYESVKIPGRSGALTILQGEDVYDNIQVTCTCIVDNPFEIKPGEFIDTIGKICKWLKGSGSVKFAHRTNGYYVARIANQISFDKVIRGNPHRTFQVIFDCQPYFMLDVGNVPIVFENVIPSLESDMSSRYVYNPQNLISMPIYHLYFNPHVSQGQLKYAEIGFTVGGSMSIGEAGALYNDNNDAIIPELYIDTETKYAYYNGKSYSYLLSGDWMKIPDATSIFTYFGCLTNKIEIYPRWRCLG